ncbi:MAG: hypothetical protein AUI14_04630 [Actinobacteria bacterium 13_2_20CM_2_71_6]|nr:MAG: hypothetical protein AUI14_04630 [Actinobacteria bacterium 13_2_20CM_2_71_6]
MKPSPQVHIRVGRPSGFHRRNARGTPSGSVLSSATTLTPTTRLPNVCPRCAMAGTSYTSQISAAMIGITTINVTARSGNGGINSGATRACWARV